MAFRILGHRRSGLPNSRCRGAGRCAHLVRPGERRYGATIMSMGRGAPATPYMPKRLSNGCDPIEFDPAILGLITNIKDSELGM